MNFIRDNCEPCFQFYSGGQLSGIIRGCNAPLLETMIREKTELEAKILAGEAERAHFVDPMLEDASNGKIYFLLTSLVQIHSRSARRTRGWCN